MAALLAGESTLIDLPATDVFFRTWLGHRVPGKLKATSYLISFDAEGSLPSYAAHLPATYFRIPMCILHKVERNEEAQFLRLVCRDCRVLDLGFNNPAAMKQVYNLFSYFAFPENPTSLFAFEHKKRSEDGKRGEQWQFQDLRREFRRQGILDDSHGSKGAWRVTDINEDFRYSPTYPSVLVVPRGFSEDSLREVAAFRSRQRIPAFTWMHPGNGTTMWRSSQPLVGVKGNSCSADERLCQLINEGCPVSYGKKLLVADCRPKLNAMGNKAQGKGWETYSCVDVEFLNIHHIHAMRDSMAKVHALVVKASSAQAPLNDISWWEQVEETQWLKHVRTVLAGAVRVASAMHREGLSVLVHCSDGWDRTSQIVCLAEMLMDPYYRTLKGFCQLIVKDWIAFGHQFQERIGHGSSKHDSQQRSPVYIQFLDCTWQLLNQFPTLFEFNSKLLVFLAHHLYTCRFGDFLFDCERERVEAGLYEKTLSMWDYLVATPAPYLNELYNPATTGVLIPEPCAVLRNVQLWNEYFLRWSPVPSTVGRPTLEAHSAALGANLHTAHLTLTPVPERTAVDGVASSSPSSWEMMPGSPAPFVDPSLDAVAAPMSGSDDADETDEAEVDPPVVVPPVVLVDPASVMISPFGDPVDEVAAGAGAGAGSAAAGAAAGAPPAEPEPAVEAASEAPAESSSEA